MTSQIDFLDIVSEKTEQLHEYIISVLDSQVSQETVDNLVYDFAVFGKAEFTFSFSSDDTIKARNDLQVFEIWTRTSKTFFRKTILVKILKPKDSDLEFFGETWAVCIEKEKDD
jgi:hypothetical protein